MQISEPQPNWHEYRVLVLAPIGRDASMTADFLIGAGLQVEICPDIQTLCDAAEQGVGLLFVTGEALSTPLLKCLLDMLERQPPWSDIPLVVLTSGGGEVPRYDDALHALEEKGNVTLIERPVRGATLLSAVRSAIRARHRQYDVRDHIQEELRTKEALAQSEERLRIALEAARLGTWQLDIATGILDCTPSCKANFGLESESEFTYKMLLDAIVPEHLEAMQSAVRAAIQEHTIYRHEYPVIWPDGSTHWILASGRVNYNAAGEPVSLIGVTLDITERKTADEEREQLLALEQQARTEAEAASRLKDEFLATVSHELRTPLTAILGWSHMLRSGAGDESIKEIGLETIERNARSQAQLIDDLLDVSRIITGKLRLEMQPVNLVDIVTATLASVRPSAEAKGIRLESSFESGTAFAIGDSDRLQQVIWNLLTNAVKFTPEGGHVEVRIRQVQSQLEISVADSGQGIERDFLAVMFDRFRQADQTSTRSHGGLGLGLSIVRQLVELHGGTVHAESEGENRGSVFVVRLPQVGKFRQGREPELESKSVMPGEVTSSHSHNHRTPDLNHLRILVVDDEADTRALLQATLSQRGASVKTAESAAEAFRLFEEWTPEILVSDIGMPDEDGYSLIGRIRSLGTEQGRQVPAIALTAYARDKDKSHALAAGFQMHISKPVELGELAAGIARLSGRA